MSEWCEIVRFKVIKQKTQRTKNLILSDNKIVFYLPNVDTNYITSRWWDSLNLHLVERSRFKGMTNTFFNLFKVETHFDKSIYTYLRNFEFDVFTLHWHRPIEILSTFSIEILLKIEIYFSKEQFIIIRVACCLMTS